MKGNQKCSSGALNVLSPKFLFKINRLRNLIISFVYPFRFFVFLFSLRTSQRHKPSNHFGFDYFPLRIPFIYVGWCNAKGEGWERKGFHRRELIYLKQKWEIGSSWKQRNAERFSCNWPLERCMSIIISNFPALCSSSQTKRIFSTIFDNHIDPC